LIGIGLARVFLVSFDQLGVVVSFSMTSSTRVFQVLQALHCPCH